MTLNRRLNYFLMFILLQYLDTCENVYYKIIKNASQFINLKKKL